MPSTTNDPGWITVTVRLYSILRHREGRVIDRLSLDVPMGSRLRYVLADLQIDPGLEMILAVNSEIAEEDAELEDGDQVSIIPAISGGSIPSPLPVIPGEHRGSAMNDSLPSLLGMQVLLM